MENLSQGLSVKSVSLLSGLTAHTLRAWERRYAVVRPSRTSNGRRVYSMVDIEKLRLLRDLVNQGHSIGNLALLNFSELESLSKRSTVCSKSEVKSFQSVQMNHHFGLFLTAVREFDFEELDRLILNARFSHSVRNFVMSIVSPLLSEVGRLVALGRLDIAQEHYLSAILRNHLCDLLSTIQKSNRSVFKEVNRPVLLFATPEGDLHEFGILIAAILAGSRGFQFQYLGPNMPAISLAKTAAVLGTEIIVIGSVEADDSRLVNPLKSYIQILSRQLVSSHCKNVEIWIGGRCNFNIKKDNRCPIFHIKSLEEFDHRLNDHRMESEAVAELPSAQWAPP